MEDAKGACISARHAATIGNVSRSAKLVSVALGTHNGERFIGEQIASILSQTRPVDEIVLSDDASSDRTVEIVEAAVAAHREANGAAPELVVLRNDPAPVSYTHLDVYKRQPLRVLSSRPQLGQI